MPLLYVSTFKMYADIYFSTLLPQVDFNLPFFFFFFFLNMFVRGKTCWVSTIFSDCC